MRVPRLVAEEKARKNRQQERGEENRRQRLSDAVPRLREKGAHLPFLLSRMYLVRFWLSLVCGKLAYFVHVCVLFARADTRMHAAIRSVTAVYLA